MKVTIQNIKDGIIKWYVTDVSMMHRDLWHKTPLVSLYINGKIREHRKDIDTLMDENGQIDIDELHQGYVKLLNSGDGYIDFMQFKRIGVADLDKLLAHIKSTLPPAIKTIK